MTRDFIENSKFVIFNLKTIISNDDDENNDQ